MKNGTAVPRLAALGARIRQGTFDYVEEVKALLEHVATESLGLQARPFRTRTTRDEIVAWHGN